MISYEYQSLSTTFPDPDKGDIEYYDLRTKISLNMAGTYKSIVKGPIKHRFRQSFVILNGYNVTLSQALPPSYFINLMIAFIIATEGKIVKFTNYDGNIYYVIFLKPTYEYINSRRFVSTFYIESEVFP